MVYEYTCPDGHVTDYCCPVSEVHPVDKRPKTLLCDCGKRAKRVIASRATLCMGALGKFYTSDSTERQYGEEHTMGVVRQKHMTETLMALGASDGTEGQGKSAWAQPTAEGVADKKDKIKNGWKPPESFTFGVKSDVLEKAGLK